MVFGKSEIFLIISIMSPHLIYLIFSYFLNLYKTGPSMYKISIFSIYLSLLYLINRLLLNLNNVN